MNGYAQINFDGKTIGIRFGLPARQWLMKILQDNPSFVEGDGLGINATYAAAILFTGYKNHCALTLTTPLHDFAFFLDFVEKTVIDEGLKQQLDAAFVIWVESVEVQKIVKAVTEDETVKKKNGNRMKSKPTAMVH